MRESIPPRRKAGWYTTVLFGNLALFADSSGCVSDILAGSAHSGHIHFHRTFGKLGLAAHLLHLRLRGISFVIRDAAHHYPAQLYFRLTASN
jgi:hypothetical protein